MDHLIPVARGGKSSKNNVVPSCRPCNQTRGHKLDVERKFDQLNTSKVWISQEHQQTMGQAYENLNCFGVSKFYFDGIDPLRLSADEMLTWVSIHFTQVDLSAELDEPVLVLVWIRDAIDSVKLNSPNVCDLAKRAPGFPFGWILEHSFVVVTSFSDAGEKLKTDFTELHDVLVFHKASAKPEDFVQVDPLNEVLRNSRNFPGFALSFHVPIQHQ